MGEPAGAAPMGAPTGAPPTTLPTDREEEVQGAGALVPPAKGEEKEEDEEQCAVCYADLFDLYHGTRFLPCGHGFHTACVDQWENVHDKNTCPLCRAPIYTWQPRVGAQATEEDQAGGGWMDWGDMVRMADALPEPHLPPPAPAAAAAGPPATGPWADEEPAAAGPPLAFRSTDIRQRATREREQIAQANAQARALDRDKRANRARRQEEQRRGSRQPNQQQGRVEPLGGSAQASGPSLGARPREVAVTVRQPRSRVEPTAGSARASATISLARAPTPPTALERELQAANVAENNRSVIRGRDLRARGVGTSHPANPLTTRATTLARSTVEAGQGLSFPFIPSQPGDTSTGAQATVAIRTAARDANLVLGTVLVS